jgi:choline dehydrogenase-like flavoprotein
MYHVHGEQGADPTDPPRGPFPCEPIAHQPRMASIVASLRHQGLHPSPLPLGLLRPLESGGCILCDTCNSFPCRIQAKSDAEVCGIVPALEHPNVELWTNAYARRLVANRAATRVEAVEIDRAGRTLTVGASVFVVSCGAVNSPALLLRSRGGAHPNGLANSSGLVGRRYMAHLATMVSGISPWQRNETVFQKTVAINDFYLSRGRGSYPLGQIQSQGRIHPVMLPSGAPPRLRRNARRVPLSVYERCWTSRSIDWLAMSEDLPSDDNRVTVEAGGQIRLQYRPNNLTAHRQLVRRTKRILRKAGLWFPVAVSLGASNTTHQCGTLCFGTDARTSVLDPWCRAHDVDNLFVVDASFFPSSAAVNPGLTIVAQALRVAEHIKRTDLKTAVAPTPSSAVDRLGPVPGDERPRTND